jgi:cytochrome P450
MNTNIPVTNQKQRPADARVPGPKGFDVLCALLEYRRKGVVFLEESARKYGPVVGLQLPRSKVFLVSRPDLIAYMLVQNRDNYLKWPGTVRARMFFGSPMQTNNGELARRQRQTMSSLFRPERVRLFGETMASCTDRGLADWRLGETRNISRDMQDLTMDIAMLLHFGDTEKPALDKIRRAFLEAIGLLNDFLKPPLWFPSAGNRRFYAVMAELDAEIGALIKACREQGGDGQNDLLSGLVSLRDAEGLGLPDKQIRDELISMLSAGYFPTATALTQTLRLLALHPDVDAQVAGELREVLGGRPPVADDLGNLPYLGAVVKESLRLCPPAGGMVRIAAQEDTIDGWRIPAKSMVFVSQWVMHHSPDYFTEPERFMPERWTPDFSSSLPDFVYFPFGWGSRACIGQVWGLMETQLILAKVLQRFKLAAPDAASGNVTIDDISRQGGLHMEVQARN